MVVEYSLCKMSCWLYFWSCQLCLVCQICSWTRTFHVVCDNPPAKNTSGIEGSKKALFAVTMCLPTITSTVSRNFCKCILQSRKIMTHSTIFVIGSDTADAILWLYHPIIWRDDTLESAQASNICSCFSQIWPCRSCANTYRGSLCHVYVWAVVPNFQSNVDQLNARQHFPALELYICKSLRSAVWNCNCRQVLCPL